MARKTPAARGDRGMETLPGNFHTSFALTSYRTQATACRYALPIETAAIVAALAFGGARHG